MPGISVSRIPIPFNKGGFSYSSYWTQQYQDVYDNFIIKPDSTHRLADARMVKVLVDAGVWDKLDIFQFYAVHTNNNGEALINWIDPTKFNPELKGTVLPSFSAHNGFIGNSTESAYIDTNYNPAIAGNKYTLNSACYGWETKRTVVSPTERFGNHSSDKRNYTIISEGSGSVTVNQASTGTATLFPTPAGVYIASRTGAEDVKLYKNGIEVVGETKVSSAIPSNNMYVLAYNNGGAATNFVDATIACFFAGAGLTGDDCKTITSAIITRTFYAEKSYGNHIPMMPMLDFKGQHGFEECNGKLYAMGGSRNLTVNEYDPILNWWTKKSDLPFDGEGVDHMQSPGVRCVGNKIYFMGGLCSSTSYFSPYVYEYDPSADTYTAKTNMPTPREDFGTAVIGSKIYCFGGLSEAGATKVMEVYDTITDTWDETKASLPVYKQLGDFGAVVNGKIYAIGASDTVYSEGQVVTPVKSCYEYDPDTDTWTQIAEVPVGTVYNERGVIGTNIYQVGGCPAGPSDELATYIKDIYRYDTLNNTWTKIVDAPYGLHGTALAEYNGNLYYCGGGRNSTTTSDTKEFYKLVI